MVQEEQEAIHLTLAPKIYFSWSGAAIDVTLAPKWCKRSKSKILVFLNFTSEKPVHHEK